MDSQPWTDSSSGGIAVSHMRSSLNFARHFRKGGLKGRQSRFPDIVGSDNPAGPVPTPLNGRVHRGCWQPEVLEYYRVNAHRADLRSARMFVLGLDSSMRPEELLNLELEALQDDETNRPLAERSKVPEPQARHLLSGRIFRGQDRGTLTTDGPAQSPTTTLAAESLRKLVNVASIGDRRRK